MKRPALVAALVLWATTASAQTYYVDPTCGSSGDGTTTSCGANGPFRRWAEVPWASGNTYSQKGGTTAYEQITVAASGTAESPITIGSYGTGKAILDGGIPIPAADWKVEDAATGVYSMTSFSYPMLEDSTFLKSASSAGCADGNYYFASGSKSYYKPTRGVPSDHLLERMRYAGIKLGTNSFLTVKGLVFSKYRFGITGDASASGSANSHITITENEFRNLEFGVWLNVNSAVSRGNVISNNKFDFVFSSIELGSVGCETPPVVGNFQSAEIAGNAVGHCSQVDAHGAPAAYDWELVDRAGWDKEGIGMQNMIGSIVHDNDIKGSCRGIVLYTCPSNSSYGNRIYRNYIATDRSGIVLLPSVSALSFSGNSAYYNVLIGGASDATNATVVTNNVSAPSTTYNTIYNNTVVSSVNGIYAWPNTDYFKIENNIFYGAARFHIAKTGDLPHLLIDYNLYSPGAMWHVNGSSLSWDKWKGAGYDADSPAPADPLFANASAGNYLLTSSSPAVNRGANLGLTSDFVGRTVPVGSGVDMGAYEFVAPSAPERLQAQ